MIKVVQRFLEAFGEFIIAGLENLTDELKQYPESRYWQGYKDAINHLNREEHDARRKN